VEFLEDVATGVENIVLPEVWDSIMPSNRGVTFA
jgi:hypothetical protein